MSAFGIGLAALATGVAAIIGSLALPVGTPAAPHAGFFPLAAGSLVVIASAIALAQERRSSHSPGERRTGLRRLALVAGAMCVGAVLLERAGFVTVATVVTLVLMRALGMASWGKASALSLAMSAALYVLFRAVLRLDLPAGLLGFLG